MAQPGLPAVPLPTPFTDAAQDALALRRSLQIDGVDVAVVLGSGLGAFALSLPEARSVPMAMVGHFAAPTVLGHTGVVVACRLGGRPVLVLAGRVHLYEGHSVHAVCHGVRVAAALGAHTVVLTNAAGGIDPDLAVGQLVAIRDHLNLTGVNPLVGHLDEDLTRFVDLSEAYAPELRRMARERDPHLAEGVYAGVLGPSFETPAEVRMLAASGVDLVGMSTVCETIAARHCGLRVAGFSLVTNLGAGLGPPLSHTDVLAAALSPDGPAPRFLEGFVADVAAAGPPA